MFNLAFLTILSTSFFHAFGKRKKRTTISTPPTPHWAVLYTRKHSMPQPHLRPQRKGLQSREPNSRTCFNFKCRIHTFYRSQVYFWLCDFLWTSHSQGRFKNIVWSQIFRVCHPEKKEDCPVRSLSQLSPARQVKFVIFSMTITRSKRR